MIIGFVGLKQVGKTTACEYLEGYGFVRHSFKKALVDEIKKNFPDLLQVMLGIDHGQEGTYTAFDLDTPDYVLTVDDLFDRKPPLMRALLQNYGTEVRRGDNKNYWVKQWKDTLPQGDVCVDDVRFLNEAQMVQANGGKIIRLTRPDIVPGDNHQSETEQLQIKHDFEIECEQGDHQRLYDQLQLVYEQIQKGS